MANKGAVVTAKEMWLVLRVAGYGEDSIEINVHPRHPQYSELAACMDEIKGLRWNSGQVFSEYLPDEGVMLQRWAGGSKARMFNSDVSHSGMTPGKFLSLMRAGYNDN